MLLAVFLARDNKAELTGCLFLHLIAVGEGKSGCHALVRSVHRKAVGQFLSSSSPSSMCLRIITAVRASFVG